MMIRSGAKCISKKMRHYEFKYKTNLKSASPIPPVLSTEDISNEASLLMIPATLKGLSSS